MLTCGLQGVMFVVHSLVFGCVFVCVCVCVCVSASVCRHVDLWDYFICLFTLFLSVVKSLYMAYMQSDTHTHTHTHTTLTHTQRHTHRWPSNSLSLNQKTSCLSLL